MKDDEKLPLRDYRADLPLTDADLAAIRAGVMAKIAAPKRSPFAALGWWPAFAAIALVVAALGAIVLLRQPPASPAAIPIARPTRPAPESIASSTQPAERALPAAPAPPPPVQPAHVVRRHHHARPTPTRPVLLAAAPPRVIQLQTSDPDIRIIWITR